MAPHRQYVALRNTGSAFQIEDGTMCRMPSPRPGPLRCQQEREVTLDFVGKDKEKKANSRARPFDRDQCVRFHAESGGVNWTGTDLCR
jgi:hypothetical protein